MNRRHIAIVAFVLGIAVALPLGIYGGGGGRLIDVQRSPDGRERIEFYTPARWQELFARRRDLAAFVRLVRVNDDAPLGDSGVFDLSGEGQAIWSGRVVQIGSSMRYDRDTARWTIIRE